MDCSKLQTHIQSIESTLPPPQNWSHASSSSSSQPTIFLFPLSKDDDDKDIYLVMAHTQRVCAVSICHPSKEENVLTIWTADGDQDEIITCATFLPSEKETAAVVLGTNVGRILSMELTLNEDKTAVVKKEEKMLEILPLDSSSSKPPPKEEQMEEEHVEEDSLPLSTPKKQNKSQHTNTNTTQRTTKASILANHYPYPFSPQGGVHSLTPHYHSFREQQQQIIPVLWIVYQDGTTVRTPTSSFFPSSSTSSSTIHTLSTKVHPPPSSTFTKKQKKRYKKKRYSLQNTKKQQQEEETKIDGWEYINVVPLPKHHPSLLAPLPPSAIMMKKKDKDDDEEEEEEEEFYEALSYVNFNKPPPSENDTLPTLSFHTSEDPLRYTTTAEEETELQQQQLTSSKFDSKMEENHEDKDKDGGEDYSLRGAVVGGTKALVRGVAGSVFGAVKWSLMGDTGGGGGGENVHVVEETTTVDNQHHHQQEQQSNISNDEFKTTEEQTTEQEEQQEEESDDDSDNNNNNSSNMKPPPAVSLALSHLHNTPTHNLPLGMSLLDPPRRFTSITVDPNGNLAAAADTLGRVLLIDLETKQVVRLWKGVREAVCFWIQLPRPRTSSSKHSSGGGSKGNHRSLRQVDMLTYLVVHARQRRVVEVWRMRHGPRVLSMQVEQDVQIVQSLKVTTEGEDGFARCYIIKSTSSGGHTIEPLIINDASARIEDNRFHQQHTTNKTTTTSSFIKPSSSSSTKAAALQLASLKQLLSSETNVPSTPGTIYEAFAHIHSLSDLIIALDLVGTSSHIEEGMNIDGSAFHALAVAHCQEKLRLILNDDESSVSHSHPSVLRMSAKIAYYHQLIDAYDLLHKFEVAAFNGEDDVEEKDEREEMNPRTSWGAEAVSWIETYECVTSRSIDDDLAVKESKTPLMFSSFVKACSGCSNVVASSSTVGSSDNHDEKQTILLCDSTKDRTAVLTHIFRPLLKDIFVFKIVNSILDALGIRNEYDSLQKYFGEWFMTVPGKIAANVSLFGLWSPTVRWLQEIVTSTCDPKDFIATETGEQPICLETLYTFCSQAADLQRAFLLAVVCREAISVATKQLEEKTYGQISCEDAVKPWDILLRKLRVCMLVTLRLYGAPFGPLAVTVRNIEEENAFSIYEWIARDELSVSHKQDEVVALEAVCRSNRRTFCPSLPEGDDVARWKLLQKACRVKAAEGERISKFLMSDDVEQSGPLLLYFKHFNQPIMLVAHRALLLGGKWGQEPQFLHLLEDCISALRALEAESGKYESIAAVVRAEIWEVYVRPVYRALLFGFHDVPELSEDVMAPLCFDPDWLSGLAHLAQAILSLVARTPSSLPRDDETRNTNEDSSARVNLSNGEDEDDSAKDSSWPPVAEDMMMQRLLSRPQRVSSSSLELHRAVVSASQLTDDLSELAYCVPSFDDVFLQGSLFHEMPTSSLCSEDQVNFVNRALTRKAFLATGPVVDHLELYEIENLGRTWGIDRKQIRTHFLIEMFEHGKDAMVDELMNANAHYLDSTVFISKGLEIACMRLYSVIMYLRSSRQFRGIIGMLDADTCQWVKEQHDKASRLRPRSKKNKFQNDEDQLSLLPTTHAFILRIMTMASSIKEAGATEKAHTLSIMSGTLLKAVQDCDENGSEVS